MLEYLFIRPNDYALFTPERLKNWKYVVLDEAHSYHGSLGIELSLLMRRLTGLAPAKPRFILTSATLGEQGKSENEIVNFARNLTSAAFDVQDIIFSKRIPLQAANLEYRIDGNDYQYLKANIQDMKKIEEICERYKKIVGGNVRVFLYELLVSDRNVYEIYNMLKSGSKSFYSVWSALGVSVSEEELIALIDLINIAEKNGIGLFDLKYHSFVRPLSGAYITFGKEPQLSLTKTNSIDGFKAFEVGNCRFCNAPYIIGKIQRNMAKQLDYLFQNKEVDIYENYGNNESVKLDYFPLKLDVDEEEFSESDFVEYSVCGKCGCIYPIKNLNAKKCDCDYDYKFSIYKVSQRKDDGEESVYNNIKQCLCCGHRSRSGMVKSLNLGKDQGTALIAQTLFEAIDENEDTVRKDAKLSLKMKPRSDKIEVKEKVKQFLAFSDSRQQASFAATFLDANHVRMLQKRLVWKVIEDQNYRNITIDELASYLTEIIKSKGLFSNNLSAHKNAWIALLVDLLHVDGVYDGEGLGLYYFDLDLSDIMNRLDNDAVEETFGKYDITKVDLTTIMQVVFGIFKVTPAINYVKSTLTPDEKTEYLEYRKFDNYIMYQCSKNDRKNILKT